MRILAGDIGGTNARLVYVQDDCLPLIRHEKNYASADYASLIEVIENFLEFYGIQKPLDSACLAVAGPVISGCASLTNLPWRIAEKELAVLLQTEHAYLINDLVAVGYAVPYLSDDALLVVQQGENGARQESIGEAVIVGVGTGLGAAHLLSDSGRYKVFSSEAGHVAFSPANEIQVKLLNWLHQQHTHVSVEMLLSGRGIYTLYQFFRDAIGLSESSAVKAELQGADPAQIISEHAVVADDPLCEQTLNCFIDIYAAVIGDVTLHYYPVNAVYLAGGIAPKIQSLLLSKSREFTQCFTNKGPMHDNLQRLPVRLIVDDTSGLDGAIAYAYQHYSSA